MTEETATVTTRQRRKRKWDQPAESIVSAAAAMPGLLPFSAGALTGMGALPGVFPYYFPTMSTATVQSATTQVIPTAAVHQSAAAIVQKFNQDLASKGLLMQAKIQDELIAREITINDAEPGVRYKLTKRQTQEEIQLKTGAVVITRGRYRPPNGSVEAEKPLYLHISAGVNLKDTAERIKAVDQAASLVEEMLKQGQQVQMPLRNPLSAPLSNGSMSKPLTANIFVGFEADPAFNLIGRIHGPNDQYINHIMNETGASVILRGRGSGIKEGSSGEELPQPLHLLLSSDNLKSLEDAKTLTENLLQTIRTECFPFRLPPYQLLSGAVQLGPPAALMNYPNSHQAPYQVSVGSLPQHSYGGYYPSVGGAYPPPYPPSQPPFSPLTPATVATSSDQSSPLDSSTVNFYANMLPATKAYGAVPPPSQLLGDQSASTEDSTETLQEKKPRVRIRERFSQSSSTIESKTSCSSSATPFLSNLPSSSHSQSSVSHAGHASVPMPFVTSSQLLQHHWDGTSPIPVTASQVSQTLQTMMPGQPVVPSYSAAFVQAPMTSSYPGYSGVYPEASPLQQVAQALQRPPLPVSVKPIANSAFLASLTKAQSSSFQEKHPDKQPAQRRKFQEFPVVGGKDASMDEKQGRRGMISHGSESSKPSQDPAPPSSINVAPPTSMPPPPPKCFSPASSTEPVSPPSSVQSKTSPLASVTAGVDQPDEHAARHGTGLKLVEYGEEEEESSAGLTRAPQLRPFSNGKPFWAA